MNSKEWTIVIAVVIVVAVASSLLTANISGNVVGVKSGTNYKVYTSAEIDSKLSSMQKTINSFESPEFTLTSTDVSQVLYLRGIYYKFNLLSASDTDATIRLFGSNGTLLDTKTIKEGTGTTMSGVTVEVLNADEENLALKATLRVRGP